MTENPNPPRCPLCRLTLRQVGRYVQALDDARRPFVFEICTGCSLRLDRLPRTLQIRQQTIALHRIAENPERYRFRVFDDETAARLYCQLAAEVPRGDEEQ